MSRHAGKRRGGRGYARKIVLHRPAGATCELGPPEPYPLRAAVLNLDAATRTGVALYINGRLRAYDECDANDPNARRDVIRDCQRAAEVRALPLVIVTEAPWGGFVSAAVSLAGTVRLWRDTWRACGGDAWHFVELTAGQWRRAVIGRASMTREQVRAWEALHGRARIAEDMPARRAYERGFRLGGDAAAAICLGMVTSRSSGVRKRLGCDLTRPLTAAERPK